MNSEALLIGALTLALLPVLAYLARREIERLGAELKELRHKTTNDINALGMRLQVNREEMLSDYVTHERFTEHVDNVMQPIRDGVEEIKNQLRELGRRLDERGHGHD